MVGIGYKVINNNFIIYNILTCLLHAGAIFIHFCSLVTKRHNINI